MHRRDFLKFIGTGAALLATPAPALAYYDEIATWRTFRLNYHIALPEESSSARLWLPMPEAADTIYQRNMGSVWSRGLTVANLYNNEPAPAFYGEWSGKGARTLTVGSMIKTADRHVAINAKKHGPIPREVKRYLEATEHLPLEGLLKTQALQIVKNCKSESEKAHAIYDWVIENGHYDASIAGCGHGDAGEMLKTGNLGGKSADIVALFVGLSRAVGIPAREAYGILLGDANGATGLPTSYHVRGEFYLAGTGWVPVDPAEIHRVMLEEKRSLADERIAQLRKNGFGSWKMNWIGLNHERDVPLPQLASKMPFFIYPYAEVGGKFLDGADPSSFEHRIEVNEMVATGIHFTFKAS